MDTTTVKAEFSIEGEDLKPEIITELLQINPDETWEKGDSIPGKSRIRRSGNWSIGTRFEESFDINDQLSQIVNIIKPKKEKLQNIREAYKLEYGFIVIIKIEDNLKPAIHFDTDLIEFVADIKAVIGVDLYIYS
ncbi:DUF4279 domain-containing protein [Listeria booriae]|uniref:DUF4279 domain-containing protein n=1 Tax=Listeria booriae TaxID=1552123 RepID=A0A842F0X1_9LIST|nr:DUF4279 domain-containing protein [Listeria booriae]MBC1210560.1 DUF4279 domain-containing protein [Listeria booriae]MBC2244117.1 DUF4279 domain-containing protein [Listeria booriae]